jgi:uncharacterized protein YbjT (DUF2867 family)
MSEPKTVLVAGATGRFREIVEKLRRRGHRVRAGTRDPDSPDAQRLASLGAEPVVANFDEPGSLASAALGVDAVFASGTAHHVGPQGEEAHGRNLAAAVAAATVPHLVFVSGDGAVPDSPLPLFQSKWRVEEAIRASGVPSTILAPTYLMENLFNPWNLGALRAGIYPSPIAIDRPLQQTAATDLLGLAVLAIERPDRLTGRRIALASDELTAEEAAAAISGVIPRTLEPGPAPEELPPPVSFLFAWLESAGHRVEIGALRDEFPEIAWHAYGTWAATQRERFRELCTHPEPVLG